MAHMPVKKYREEGGAAERLKILVQQNFGGFRGLRRLLLTYTDHLLGTTLKFTRPQLSGVDRLVFVCLANLQRSAFAQAVARQAGLPAASFGLNADDDGTVPPLAERIAAELGCPIQGHRPTHLAAFEPHAGDLYLVMELRHAHHLLGQGFPPQRIALLGHWSRPRRLHLHDPFTAHEDYMRTCFTLIGSAVLNVARELREHNPGRPDGRR